MLRGLILACAILLVSERSTAQAPVLEDLRPGPSVLRASEAHRPLEVPYIVEVSDTTPARRVPATYWREGALLGGTVVGLFLTSFALHGCTHDETDSGPCWDNVLLGAGVGFATGGTLGALLGGLIQKPQESADSVISE
jgi:hypothetical protein